MKTQLQKVYSKLPKEKSEQHKVALGLVDDFSYNFEDLGEEVGRLSYTVNEWFDDKYDELQEAYVVLKDVYINNSESYISESDIAGDFELLQSIQSKSDELGLDVEDVYPDWQEHVEVIRRLEELEGQFDNQKRIIEEF